MSKPKLAREDFISCAFAFGVAISAETLAQFETYERELLSWNKRMNLMAKGDEGNLWTRHFLDSLIGWSFALSRYPTLDTRPPAILDIGTGAGFPGLPIKLAWPDIRLTLVESIRKKTLFLKHLLEVLNLKDVTVVCSRAEPLAREPEHRGHYDFALARAVGSVEELKKLGFPLLKDSGSLIAWRGEDSDRHPASSSYRLPNESRERNILILSNRRNRPMGVDSASVF